MDSLYTGVIKVKVVGTTTTVEGITDSPITQPRAALEVASIFSLKQKTSRRKTTTGKQKLKWWAVLFCARGGGI